MLPFPAALASFRAGFELSQRLGLGRTLLVLGGIYLVLHIVARSLRTQPIDRDDANYKANQKEGPPSFNG